MVIENRLYGASYSNIKGYKLILGNSGYNHRFGGSDWKLPVCKNCCSTYQQLITLDLNDPKLNLIIGERDRELPLISCLNCSAWWEYQCYEIDFIKKEINIIKVSDDLHECLQDEDQFPTVFPEKKMVLVELEDKEKPINEDLYFDLIDSIGDTSICRVMGEPLFMEDVIEATCPRCKSRLSFIAQIAPAPFGNMLVLDGVDFYFGEGVLYYYYCKKCKAMHVYTQGA